MHFSGFPLEPQSGSRRISEHISEQSKTLQTFQVTRVSELTKKLEDKTLLSLNLTDQPDHQSCKCPHGCCWHPFSDCPRSDTVGEDRMRSKRTGGGRQPGELPLRSSEGRDCWKVVSQPVQDVQQWNRQSIFQKTLGWGVYGTFQLFQCRQIALLGRLFFKWTCKQWCKQKRDKMRGKNRRKCIISSCTSKWILVINRYTQVIHETLVNWTDADRHLFRRVWSHVK